MKCPVCNINLLISERHGIEIDYCPECRGIWLDRGELEKIMERAGEYERPHAPRSEHREESHGHRHEEHGHSYEKHGEHGYHEGRSHRKKESFLTDLFDF